MQGMPEGEAAELPTSSSLPKGDVTVLVRSSWQTQVFEQIPDISGLSE
jgi:hypothetical protein